VTHRRTPAPLRSFTLVELLVVIAILGLVAGLAIPAIGKARETANRGGCALNLKTLAAGVLTYATENNGALPTGSNNAYAGANVHWWQAALQTTNFYNKEAPGMGPRCMYCPSQKLPMRPKSGGAVVKPPYDFGYGINVVLVGTGASNDVPVRLARFTNLSQLILLADGAAYDEIGGSHSWNLSNINPDPTKQKMSARHGSNVTVAWCDGHVSFTDRDRLTNTAKYPESTNFWGRWY